MISGCFSWWVLTGIWKYSPRWSSTSDWTECSSSSWTVSICCRESGCLGTSSARGTSKMRSLKRWTSLQDHPICLKDLLITDNPNILTGDNTFLKNLYQIFVLIVVLSILTDTSNIHIMIPYSPFPTFDIGIYVHWLWNSKIWSKSIPITEEITLTIIWFAPSLILVLYLFEQTIIYLSPG